MARVSFSSRARQDLREIGDHIALDNPGHAIVFVDELTELCLGLAEFPRRFRRAPRYGPNAHRRAHGNYVILYDVAEDEVRIIAIVHAARDIDALLG